MNYEERLQQLAVTLKGEVLGKNINNALPNKQHWFKKKRNTRQGSKFPGHLIDTHNW